MRVQTQFSFFIFVVLEECSLNSSISMKYHYGMLLGSVNCGISYLVSILQFQPISLYYLFSTGLSPGYQSQTSTFRSTSQVFNGVPSDKDVLFLTD